MTSSSSSSDARPTEELRASWGRVLAAHVQGADDTGDRGRVFRPFVMEKNGPRGVLSGRLRNVVPLGRCLVQVGLERPAPGVVPKSADGLFLDLSYPFAGEAESFAYLLER